MVAVDAVSVATFLAWAGFNRRSRKQTKRVERREDRWVVIFWFPVRGCLFDSVRGACNGRIWTVGGCGWSVDCSNVFKVLAEEGPGEVGDVGVWSLKPRLNDFGDNRGTSNFLKLFPRSVIKLAIARSKFSSLLPSAFEFELSLRSQHRHQDRE